MILRADAAPITPADVERVGGDHMADPGAAGTLHAEAYTAQRWYDFEQSAIFRPQPGSGSATGRSSPTPATT